MLLICIYSTYFLQIRFFRFGSSDLFARCFSYVLDCESEAWSLLCLCLLYSQHAAGLQADCLDCMGGCCSNRRRSEQVILAKWVRLIKQCYRLRRLQRLWAYLGVQLKGINPSLSGRLQRVLKLQWCNKCASTCTTCQVQWSRLASLTQFGPLLHSL
jgi:hypothetical protein